MPEHLAGALASILGLLTEIRDELRILNTPPPESEDDDEPVCEHQTRLDLSTVGGGEHWICQTCGLEYRASTALTGARES